MARQTAILNELVNSVYTHCVPLIFCTFVLMFIFVVLPFSLCFAFHCFSGAGRAAGPLCVCGQTIAFVLNDFVNVVFISVVCA